MLDGSGEKRRGLLRISPLSVSSDPPSFRHSLLDLRKERAVATPLSPAHLRPRVRGKFIYLGDKKLYIRGVTYGTFRPDADGNEYGDPQTVVWDFAQMAASGLNAVRTYTVPPRWLLDTALQHGLHVMIGLPWEQHITFLDDPKIAAAIVERVRAGVRACAGHAAVLCYAIGNEIPASIVRWHGPRRVERFLERLYRVAKAEDPDGLVTYVNFPSTEYLRLPFMDFVSFNVYLEQQERLRAYLARLQNLAGDAPLVMAEIGLDSRRNGQEAQARTLDWQVRTAFAAGCAGTFVFAWTDAWYRGGYDIDDWDFGLVDRQRRPKPALAAVANAFAAVPFPPEMPWPRISVVVCSYNGARTIRDCCEGLTHLEYPDYEVIVVDDGSTDTTAAIAREYYVRVISTENRGLSNARNTGLAAATGEIVAYLDDDASPDPHWLQYLAATFLTTDSVGGGGPNIAPPGDGFVAECVDNAPGNPVHVLLTDQEAEHIPGCNMAFRKAALEAVGGFDPQCRVAGDDVDICWRLRERGGKIGFNPAAMVWHHRRNRVRMYWKQQKGYGKAEALLESKWPEKYNAAGHIPWSGHLYGKGIVQPLRRPRRIYHGTWGSALFQSIYQPAREGFWEMPLMPEWYLVIAALIALAAVGVYWRPLLLLGLFLLLPTLATSIAQSVLAAQRATFVSVPARRAKRMKMRALVTLLYLSQPIARLRGRMGQNLTPWRQRIASRWLAPMPRTTSVWSEQWHEAKYWLECIGAEAAHVCRGGAYDRWDLEVRGGLLGAARLRMAIEEHGGGKQVLRFRTWPRVPTQVICSIVALGSLMAAAWHDSESYVAIALGILAVILIARSMYELGKATSNMLERITALHSAGDRALTRLRPQ